jgi:uncharacterized protein (TIGR00251 family)
MRGQFPFQQALFCFFLFFFGGISTSPGPENGYNPWMTNSRPPMSPAASEGISGPPEFIRPGPGGIFLSIKLQPGSSRNHIGPPVGLELKIRVKAPPVDDAANSALIDLLAQKLGRSRSGLQITRGKTSRHKIVWIRSQDMKSIIKCLGEDD